VHSFFFATTVNYLDRQVLSLLAPDLSKEFGWTNTDYANITAVFQFVYAIAMLFAGRVIDRLGTKSGYTWSIIIWSSGCDNACLCDWIGETTLSLLSWIGTCSGACFHCWVYDVAAVLAIGEAGNFPAAIKATAEYFPKKERSFATGIFNSGSNIGAVLAPLTVPWIARNYGWEEAFVIIGAIGFLWLFFWQILYSKAGETKKAVAGGIGVHQQRH
jgi:ACS family hexuronate transporter-like MFS transporter